MDITTTSNSVKNMNLSSQPLATTQRIKDMNNIKTVIIVSVVIIISILLPGERSYADDFRVSVPKHQLLQLIDDVCGDMVDREEERSGTTYSDYEWETKHETCMTNTFNNMTAK